MELIGDRWGREPRYGLKVIHDDPAEAARRQKVVDVLQSISPLLKSFEDGAKLTGLKHLGYTEEVAAQLGVDVKLLPVLAARVQQPDPDIERITVAIRELFEELGELIGAGPQVEGAYFEMPKG